jgi:hypothetical protein
MVPKTITLYKYASVEYAKDVLCNQRMYLSDGRNFNDPFELSVVNKNTGKTNFVDGLHILCLTNSYRKKLMWSHYADSHKGICYTVEVPKEMIRSICYTGERVYTNCDIDKIISNSKKGSKKSVSDDFTNFSFDKKVAFIKDQKWIDEKEFRIVFDAQDEEKLVIENEICYLPVKIKNVYLGVNFEKNDDDNVKKDILSICKERKIEIR